MKPFEVFYGGLSAPHFTTYSLCTPGEDETSLSLVALLDAALDGRTQIDLAPLETAMSAPAAKHVLRAQWQDVALEALWKGEAASAVWTTAIKALPGLSRVMSKSIDFRLAAIQRIDDAAIERVLALAAREGRSRPVIIASPAHDNANGRIERLLLNVMPHADAPARISSKEAARRLARNQFTYDLVIAAEEDAEVLCALAQELAGCDWLASSTVVYAHGADSFAEHEGTVAQDQSPHVEATILAFAEMLGLTGHFDAALRLKNALLKTLEDNLHTEAVPHIAPYTCEVSPVEFIAAVQERIGGMPSAPSLRAPSRSSLSRGADASAPPKRNGLKLVHSA